MIRKNLFAVLFSVFLVPAAPIVAQTTSFTHQGTLAVANGNYEFEFKLFDTPATGTGTQQGATLQRLSPNTVTVTNNAFTVPLDFGAAVFTGSELYLETSWRVVGGSFTVLSPRERVTAVYANRSLSAATSDTATNATQLGGLPASGFIQNTAGQQAGRFNIVGNGTAGGTLSGGVVNAATQFNLGGSRILSNAGNENLFAGIDAGLSNTGHLNSFFGTSAGSANTSGFNNSFFGARAGTFNNTGNNNSFFGAGAGYSNSSGGWNAFYGSEAGTFNTSGWFNTFFGAFAGHAATNAYNNSFFGYYAGVQTVSGGQNSFFGQGAGYQNISGFGNTFVGASTGFNNSSGVNNSLFGINSNVSNGLSNATAIGAGSFVGQSNSLVLGSINGVNGATADTKVGIGTTAPSFRLQVIDPSNTGLRVQTNTGGGAVASFGGNGDFQIDAPGIVGGRFAVTQAGNTGIGIAAPSAKLHVRANNGNVLIGDAGCNSGFTGIGFGSSMSGCTNYSLLGDGTNTFINRPVGGSIFFRSGNSTQMSINVGGTVSINLLTGGGTTQLCRNPANEIAVCSSSLRYKTDLAPFSGGLSLVNRLQPITFVWKANGEADLGLGAEEVAKVEPLLVTRNEKGEVEGVKYDRVAVVLLNAVKEQQQQIKQQAEQIQQQQRQLEGLKRLACRRQPEAEICKTAVRSLSSTSNRSSLRRQNTGFRK